MEKLYELSRLEASLWKNNQGITYQIDIFPSDASLSLMNFDYRLSMALIKSDNQFSEFKGYRRLLTVIKGDGLLINDAPLLKNKIMEFEGERKIFSKKIGVRDIYDFGLIYNPQKINPNMYYEFDVDKLFKASALMTYILFVDNSEKIWHLKRGEEVFLKYDWVLICEIN